MECLKGYIGLRAGCGNTTPRSGRYVNSLPGISLMTIDNLANKEQVTFNQVWKDIEDRASADFGTRVTEVLAKKYRLKSVLENIDLGEEIDTANNQTAASANYRGFIYELRMSGQTYAKPSALQMVYVQRIKFYLKANSNVILKVYDLDLKKELYTSESTYDAGWNYVDVYQGFAAFRLFFAMNCTGIESPYQPLNNYALDCCNACAQSIYGMGCSGMIYGATAAVSAPYTTVKGSNLFGLSAEFGLLCSFENFICSNLKTIELAWWYALGAEVMMERLASPRVNLTTIDTKDAEQLRNYYLQKVDEELGIALNGISLNMNDCCIECNAPIQVVESRM